MRLRTLTNAKAGTLSANGPIYSRPHRDTLPDDERTVRLAVRAPATPILTDQDGTVLIAVPPPPPRQLAQGGTLELSSKPSRFDRLRYWSVCIGAVLLGAALGISLALIIAAAADAIGSALG